MSELEKGDVVEAKYPDGKKWYAGKIKRAHSDGTYTVELDKDGEKMDHLEREFIRADSDRTDTDYATGDRVEMVGKKGKTAPGTITKEHRDGKFTITTDDGDITKYVDENAIRPLKDEKKQKKAVKLKDIEASLGEEYMPYGEIFDIADTDGSGFIERGELKALMGFIGFGNSDAEVDAAMKEIDTDANGQVSKVEFLVCTSNMVEKGLGARLVQIQKEREAARRLANSRFQKAGTAQIVAQNTSAEPTLREAVSATVQAMGSPGDELARQVGNYSAGKLMARQQAASMSRHSSSGGSVPSIHRLTQRQSEAAEHMEMVRGSTADTSGSQLSILCCGSVLVLLIRGCVLAMNIISIMEGQAVYDREGLPLVCQQLGLYCFAGGISDIVISTLGGCCVLSSAPPADSYAADSGQRTSIFSSIRKQDAWRFLTSLYLAGWFIFGCSQILDLGLVRRADVAAQCSALANPYGLVEFTYFSVMVRFSLILYILTAKSCCKVVAMTAAGAPGSDISPV
jgi:hypothetical protein